MTAEEWRPIPDFRDYVVSNLGQVASIKGGQFRILSGGKTEMGYRNVLLYQDGQRVGRRVHQLVALVFHGPRPEGLEIRHLDGDQLNNAARNLRYGTHAENMWDRRRHAGRLLIVGPDRGAPRAPRAPRQCGHDVSNVYVYPNGRARCRPCKSAREMASRTRRAFRAAGIAA